MGRKKGYIQIGGALLCGICLAAGLLTGCGNRSDDGGAAEKETKITVGCDDFAPFSYVDGDGNMTGIDVKLGEEAFRRMGYQADFRIINWEEKKTLLESGAIDCIWSSFSMDGREEEYRWSGPYMRSHQVVAVNVNSDIHSLKDLKDKVIAVQSTTKPEEMLRSHHKALPQLRQVISVQKRDLIFLMLSKGYVDAIAAHDTGIRQFMSESGLEFRILEEPLLTVGLGVAFDKTDPRGLSDQLNTVLREMYDDGTTERIIGEYFQDTDRYLGGLYENR